MPERRQIRAPEKPDGRGNVDETSSSRLGQTMLILALIAVGIVALRYLLAATYVLMHCVLFRT